MSASAGASPLPSVPAGAWAIDQAPRPVWSRLMGIGVAALLLAVGVGLLVGQHQVRIFEAMVARPPLAVFLGRAVHVPGTDLVFYPDYDSPGFRALKVTFSCSSVPLVAPLALLGSAMAFTRRFRPTRVLAGVTLAIATVFVVNLVRILMIAVSTFNFGLDGYEVSHRIVGSAVTVVGACLAFVVTYRVVSSVARPDRPSVGR